MSKSKRAKAVRESDNFDYDFSFELDGATLEILPTKARGGSIEKKLVKLLSGDWPSEERLVQRLGGTWGGSTAPTDDPTVKKVYVYTEGRSPAMRQKSKASKATPSIQESPSYRQVLPTFYQGEVDEGGIFEMYFQAYNGMGYSIDDELTLPEVLLKLDGYLIRAEGQGREVVGSSASRGGEVTIEISYPGGGVGDDEGYLIVRPDPKFAKCESCGEYVRRSEIGRDSFGFDSCESCRIRDAEDEERFDDFEESQDSMYDMIRAHSRSKVREAYDALDQNQSLIPGSEDYYREPNPVEVFQSLPAPPLGDDEWSQREFFPALKSLGWTIDYMDFQNEGNPADWDEVFYHAHPDSRFDSDYALYKNRTTGVWGLVDGVYDSSFVLIPPKDGIRYVESKRLKEGSRKQEIFSWFQSLPKDVFGPYYWWIDDYQEEGVWLILNPEPDDMVWAEDEPTPNEEVVSYVLSNCPVPLDLVNVQRTTSGTRDFIFLPKEVAEGKRDRNQGFNDRLYPGLVESKRVREGRGKKDPVDAEIEQAWYRLAGGVQVNIMDIPRIFSYCRDLMTNQGMSVDDAVQQAIRQFQVAESLDMNRLDPYGEEEGKKSRSRKPVREEQEGAVLMVGMHKFVCVEDNHDGFLYTTQDGGISLFHDVGGRTWMGWLGSPEAYDTTTYFFYGDTPEEALELAGLLESKKGGKRLKGGYSTALAESSLQDPSSVAGIIWSQIGMMTKMACGARDIITSPDGIIFRVGGGKPARWIEVTLDPSDTYNVRLLKNSKNGTERRALMVGSTPKYVPLVEEESLFGVYADMLDEVIYRMVNK